MAHQMEGKWRSRLIQNGVIKDDGDFYLNAIDPQTGVITSANHASVGEQKTVSGSVTRSEAGFIFTLTHDDFNSMTKERKYEGLLVVELTPITSLVVGRMVKRSKNNPALEADAAALEQEDGTVIIVRP